MNDVMETGGVGKNPAIDKINNLNTAQNRANAVTELERRVFRTESPRSEEVLQRRRQLMEDFHICFKRKGEKEYGDILYERKQWMHAGEYSDYRPKDGGDKIADEISERVLSDGRREKAQMLPVERATRYYFGKS